MFAMFKSCAFGAGLALVGAVAVPAFAAEPIEAAPAVNSQIVVRDATTGQLRAPTTEEAATLQAKFPRLAAGRMLPKVHASGAHGVRMTDESASYSVVVRQADGKLIEVCFDSREEAEAAAKSASIATTANLPTE